MTSDDRLTIDEPAESLAVPRHHLAKAVQRPQHLGLLETVRGCSGGVCLVAAAHRLDRRPRPGSGR
jgi:Rrf2 family nitric oxide-sensitive transcriptional repressor